MEPRKMALMHLFCRATVETQAESRLVDTVREGEGGAN